MEDTIMKVLRKTEKRGVSKTPSLYKRWDKLTWYWSCPRTRKWQNSCEEERPSALIRPWSEAAPRKGHVPGFPETMLDGDGQEIVVG
jgi:hypothetical protein